MALAHIDTTSNTGGSATASIPVPASATSGRVLVLVVVSTGAGTFTPPTGFTLTKFQPYFFSSKDTRVYEKIAGSESGSYDTTIPFSYWAVSLSVYDDPDGTTPIEASASGEAYDTSFATGSLTTLTANDILMGIWSGGDQALTIPGTMTSRLAIAVGGGVPNLYVATEDAPTATSYNRTATSATTSYSAILLAIKPGGGGGGGATLPPKNQQTIIIY